MDNDGNGYVDDVHGWDFYWDDASFIHGDGAESHATHVAGSIGAQGGNGIGVAGVGWRTTIIPVKFLGGPSGQGTMSDAAAALDYVTALRLRGVNVVAANASWGCLSTSPGCGLSTVLQGAIERAGAAGVLVVAAAGNGGADIDATPFYPASQTCPQGGWDCIISVANIGSTGARSGNFGASSVDLGAPGGGILSTTPSASYGTMSGTSMAAAYVSGAIALCASLDPGVGPATLRSRVLGSGTTTGSLDGSTVTGKRLDVGALAQQCGATVPDVVGLMAGAAHDAIEAADLDPVRDPDAFHASVPAGKVISQQPDPGRLRAHGSPVHYVVSKGPAPVPVPNVVNSTPSAAASAISSAGFQSAQGADEHSASVPTGLVARQDPSAGALRVPGSTVTFFVSKGPAPITVPNVVGSTPGAASAAISGTGFSPVQGADEYSASVAAGLVARQDPPAGTSLPPGSTVSYFVSKGRPAVPDVVNKPEAAAIADLAAVTLVPGPRTQAYHASIPAGNALSTNPPPGTLVDPGSAVAYVISLGPIAVPNLVGLSQATAASTLTAAGLSSGAVTQAMDATIPAGSVISQSPVAGTAAGSGDPVSYVVSVGPAPVAVPDVVGQPEATALSGLAAAGLTAGARSEAYDATIAAGYSSSARRRPRGRSSRGARPSPMSSASALRRLRQQPRRRIRGPRRHLPHSRRLVWSSRPWSWTTSRPSSGGGRTAGSRPARAIAGITTGSRRAPPLHGEWPPGARTSRVRAPTGWWPASPPATPPRDVRSTRSRQRTVGPGGCSTRTRTVASGCRSGTTGSTPRRW